MIISIQLYLERTSYTLSELWRAEKNGGFCFNNVLEGPGNHSVGKAHAIQTRGPEFVSLEPT